MKYTLVAALFMVSFGQLQANYAYEAHDRLVGRVIHIESRASRGYWLAQNNNQDDDGSRYLDFVALNERDTYTTAKVQFMVTQCGDFFPYLCMESLSLKNYYLTAGYEANGDGSETVKLQHSTYINDDDRFHWRVFCKNDELEECQFESVRFQDPLMPWIIIDGRGHKAGMGRFGELRIHAPKATDGLVEIYQNTNTGTVDQTAKYSTSVGVEKSSSTSSEMTSTTSVEIGASFKVFSFTASTEFSKTWGSASSNTWTKATTVEHSLTLPARSNVVLKQLKGNYADVYTVGEDVYLIVVTSLDSGKTTEDMIKP